MDLYGFKDDSRTGNDFFELAVSCVVRSEFYKADALLRHAMLRGHMPSFFNASILNGQGCLSPFNIDVAVECYKIAAQLGHERAKELSELINKADIAHLTSRDVAYLASNLDHGKYLNPIHTMVACRFYKCPFQKGVSDFSRL